MEGNYPSTREKQEPLWLASPCCYAVIRRERERGVEKMWESLKESTRERPERLWGRRRPHLQCCVQKECLTTFQRGKRGEKGWRGGGNRLGKGAGRGEGKESGSQRTQEKLRWVMGKERGDRNRGDGSSGGV
ncbi:hypothetical protein CRENBAI_003981 [Crenichthys baileyi]|uniref:Uncharacterized protein n=1 Tax=Crenichthys baileyi TaxID=28760 RepID=A0AAV9SJ69_9TELE